MGLDHVNAAESGVQSGAGFTLSCHWVCFLHQKGSPFAYHEGADTSACLNLTMFFQSRSQGQGGEASCPQPLVAIDV